MNHRAHTLALDLARDAAANADLVSRPADPAQELEFAKMYSLLAIADALVAICAQLEYLKIKVEIPDVIEVRKMDY